MAYPPGILTQVKPDIIPRTAARAPAIAKNGASAHANAFKIHQAGVDIGLGKRIITGIVIIALKIANTTLAVCRKEFI